MKKIRVADYVASFIKKIGVDCVFMVPGGGAMFLNDAIQCKKGLDFVANHNEQASSISAEAYSRVTENIGVAIVTTGPGATNAITGVAGAWIESVPLMIISGQVKTSDLKGNSGVRQMGPQEVDIVSIVKSITKYATTVKDPKKIRSELEKAYQLATTGRKGPVWVDIPLDIQAAPIEPAKLLGFKKLSDKKLSDKFFNKYDEIITLINSSKRPIILAGHGIRLSKASKDFTKMCRILKIPVVTTWNAMDLLPNSSKLNIGKPGVVALRAPNFAIQNSDLLISIGARLDNVVTAYNPQNFAKNAKKVIVDIDLNELNKFKMKIDFRINLDAKLFIKNLNEKTIKNKINNFSDWVNRCNDWKNRYTINDGGKFTQSKEISHLQLVDTLSDHLPKNSLIVTGSSGLAIESFYMAFRNKPGQRIFLTSGLGAMGYGIPALIGALNSNKYKEVICIESDGSFLMNLQEILTLKISKKPFKLFILNNNGYASIRNTQKNYFDGRYIATGPESNLFLPDICKLFDSIGISAIKVKNLNGLIGGITKVLRSKKSIVCDISLKSDDTLWPKSAAIPQKNGSMLSMPLEDMSPLLSRNQLRAEMLCPLDPASEKIKN
jgi:acetolactate synthase-1/2/3 large subunit